MKFLEEMNTKTQSLGNMISSYKDGFKDLTDINEMLDFHKFKIEEMF